MNPIRRQLYRKFDVLVTREEISQKYLHGLLGEQTKIHVTADSAIQQSFGPLERHGYFKGERAGLAEKFLVAVSLNNYKYPGAPNPERLREEYNRSMLGLIEHLARRKDSHFLLVPQLYGNAHSDVPFLREIGAKLPSDVSWELFDAEADSDTQRRLFAMCDLHLASRYHPAIFGHTGYTPGICIYYEHKALGFMTQLGLERFAFDIRDPNLDRLRQAADELLERREQIIEQLKQRVPELQKRARRTTDLAVELLRSREIR
jgi:polysaccharide pyruvyl transferase WcaK-like protein